MAENITIAELDINTDALTKSAIETKKALDELKASQKELKKSTEDTTGAELKNEIAIKNLSTQYNGQKKVLSALTDEQNKQVKVTQASTAAINKEVTSIDQARANNKQLLAIRSSLNLKTKEGQVAQTAMNKKLDENNKFIKENVSGYEQQKIGIGDYEGALRRVFPQLGGTIDSIKSTVTGLKAQKAALQASTTATGGASKAMNIFKIALISTGIGAIVVAVGMLVAAFLSTQRGMDALDRAMAPVIGAFQALKGIIQDFATNRLDTLKANFTVTVSSMLKGIDYVRLGWAKLTGDTEAASLALEDIEKRTNEVTEAQAKLNELRKQDFNVVDRLKEGAAIQKQIVELGIQREKKEADLILLKAKLTDQIKEQELIAKSTSLSATERNKAADKALALSKQLSTAKKDIINLSIQEEELSQSLNDSGREDLKKLNQLKAQAIEADTAQKATELKFITAKNAVLVEEQALEAKKIADKKANEDAIAAEEEAANAAKLERIKVFEEQKTALQNEMDLANAETDEEKATIKAEQDLEKKTLALEQLGLDSAEETELKALLQTQQDEVLLGIKEESAKKILASEAATEAKRTAIKNKSFDAAVDLAGADTKLGKGLLAVKEILAAKEAVLELKKISFKSQAAIAKSTMAVAEGTAETAKIGFPQNIPMLLGFAAQAIGIVSAVKSAASLTAGSFYEGGQVPTGTGGTITNTGNIPTQKGGDNVLATVKTGEVILNQDQQSRAGGSAFFKSIGVPGFETGGQVGGSTVSTTNQTSSMNMDAFAEVIAAKVNSIKYVAIESEITSAQALQVEIESGANI